MPESQVDQKKDTQALANKYDDHEGIVIHYHGLWPANADLHKFNSEFPKIPSIFNRILAHSTTFQNGQACLNATLQEANHC